MFLYGVKWSPFDLFVTVALGVITGPRDSPGSTAYLTRTPLDPWTSKFKIQLFNCSQRPSPGPGWFQIHQAQKGLKKKETHKQSSTFVRYLFSFCVWLAHFGRVTTSDWLEFVRQYEILPGGEKWRLDLSCSCERILNLTPWLVQSMYICALYAILGGL